MLALVCDADGDPVSAGLCVMQCQATPCRCLGQALPVAPQQQGESCAPPAVAVAHKPPIFPKHKY